MLFLQTYGSLQRTSTNTAASDNTPKYISKHESQARIYLFIQYGNIWVLRIAGLTPCTKIVNRSPSLQHQETWADLVNLPPDHCPLCSHTTGRTSGQWEPQTITPRLQGPPIFSKDFSFPVTSVGNLEHRGVGCRGSITHCSSVLNTVC